MCSPLINFNPTSNFLLLLLAPFVTFLFFHSLPLFPTSADEIIPIHCLIVFLALALAERAVLSASTFSCTTINHLNHYPPLLLQYYCLAANFHCLLKSCQQEWIINASMVQHLLLHKCLVPSCALFAVGPLYVIISVFY